MSAGSRLIIASDDEPLSVKPSGPETSRVTVAGAAQVAHFSPNYSESNPDLLLSGSDGEVYVAFRTLNTRTFGSSVGGTDNVARKLLRMVDGVPQTGVPLITGLVTQDGTSDFVDTNGIHVNVCTFTECGVKFPVAPTDPVTLNLTTWAVPDGADEWVGARVSAPSVNGVASGLRSSACSTTPDAASAPPTRPAASTRGSRATKKICASTLSAHGMPRSKARARLIGVLPTTGASSSGTASTGGTTGESTGGGGIVCGGDMPVFPEFDRTCMGDGDCSLVFHQVDCCGSLVAWGLSNDAAKLFAEAEAECEAMYPACECATQPTLLDDGSSTENNDKIAVTCQAGSCFSFQV